MRHEPIPVDVEQGVKRSQPCIAGASTESKCMRSKSHCKNNPVTSKAKIAIHVAWTNQSDLINHSLA